MKLKIFLVFLFLILSLSLTTEAASPLDIVINEIAWMGTNNSVNDEWIELYNNTNNDIDLEGWILKSEDGSPEIKLTGQISANSFFLLERTDDETLPNVSADQIFKGALGNNGENLKLFDSSGNLIDQVNCSSGWFGGDNKTKQTMERKNSKGLGSDSQNWQTSQNSGGTPKAENSKQKIIENKQKIEEEIPTKESKSLLRGTSQNYPKGIIFNEILPSPEGSDETEEWIEIFNQNSFEVDLSDWKITDISGKIATYTFPQGTKISSQSFLILSRSETKITLNNDGDGLILTSPDEKTIDKVNYEKAPRGKSYNRIDSSWFWSANLTPGKANATSSEEELKPLSLNLEKEKQLAAVEKQFPKSSGFLSVLLIALTIAIFSGIILLILKRKLIVKK